ncbi:tetratricopeptide repeat protein [bacterium SCSIO 12741]|nr:tetratricopeptide repeat protein [bacterium SCSIO 12741]
MKHLLFTLLILTIHLIPNKAIANTDSLNAVWSDPSLPDSVRIAAGAKLAWDGYLFSQPDTAFVIANDLYEMAKRIDHLKWQSSALNIQGISCHIRGMDDKALIYFNRCLEINKELGGKKGIANMQNNIGLIYLDQEKLEKAKETFLAVLKIREELNQTKAMSKTLNNLGLVYIELTEYDKALKVFEQSLEIKKEFNDPKEIAAAYNNIGLVYHRQDSFDLALKFYELTLKIRLEVNDLRDLSTSYYNLGEVYFQKGYLDKAQPLLDKSLAIAEEIGWPDRISTCTGTLYKIQEEKGNDKEALKLYKVHVTMRDSVKSAEVTEQLAQAESRIQFEKELLIREQDKKEAERQAAVAKERRNTLQYSGIGAGVFLLFGLLFLLVRIPLPAWAVELATFLPFLILFEFLLVITDPWVESLTGGEPLYKLLVNALLAGFIFPLHSFFERLLKKRLFNLE